MGAEAWASWVDGYYTEHDALCDVATMIDGGFFREGDQSAESTVWGNLEDFLEANVLDAMASTKEQ